MKLDGILTTGFDPKPDSRDTSVVDVKPRSWEVHSTDKVLHYTVVTIPGYDYYHLDS